MRPHGLFNCFTALCFGILAACSGKPAEAPPSGAPSSPSAGASSSPSGAALAILELRPGGGTPIAAGQTAEVRYTGWLYESSAADGKGREFDSSQNTGQPFRFVVGAGQVIKGWDQGVLGMKVGAQRRLTIPPDLAYGEGGAGGVIPPGATLIFDVELVGIE